jgi:16S rRNA (cytosine1402-N4)-methyltransferase
MEHITVLLKEAVYALNLSKDSVVVDCTLGSGGHAREILSELGSRGIYIGIDADKASIEENEDLHTVAKAKVTLVKGNFREIKSILHTLHIEEVDAVVADLGWRIEQFEGRSGEKRGFSFKNDEPLAMTFGSPRDYPFTAYDIVNEWAEEDIANVIYAYGEERASRRIAKAIVLARKQSPIETSGALATIIAQVLPPQGKRRTHPATKTFQALRIAVNDEFDALRALLADSFDLLKPQGRIAIITFHSLEDRIVKEVFRSYTRDQKGVLVNKKPIVPTQEELKANPRARSAKLRIIEKL